MFENELEDMELTSHDRYKYSALLVAEEMKYGKKDTLEDSFFQAFETDINFDRKKFFCPTKEMILNILKRKFVVKLTMLKPVVDVMKYKTSEKNVSLCPISSTAKYWNLIFKNKRNVSRLIQTAQEIGLLYCANSTYQFHSFSSKSNRCKLYAYNKVVEKVLLELFKEYDISYKGEAINTSYIISIVDRFANHTHCNHKELQKLSDLMIKFKIRITQQTRLPLQQNYLMMGLHKMYPQYMEMIKTIDKDNSTMDSSDWDYAIPSFSYNRNGECIRISIRKTNQYCNLKVHNIPWDTLSKEERRRTRREVIINKFGEEHENDVKSSIYRITYLLNHGIWLDRSHDLYPMMAGFDMTDVERGLYKSPFCMKLYFSPSIDKAIASSEFQHAGTKKLFKKINARDIFTEARRRMFDLIGPSFRSEIFLHESCIYTQVAHRLRNMGFKVIQIYDGFFTDKKLEQDVFDKIVEECALNYYHKWKGYWYNWET